MIVGTQSLDPPLTSPKESILAVTNITIHPLYGKANVRPWAYDMALVQLDQEPKVEEVSRPACLPIDNQPPMDGETCLVAGWGKTESMIFDLWGKLFPQPPASPAS